MDLQRANTQPKADQQLSRIFRKATALKEENDSGAGQQKANSSNSELTTVTTELAELVRELHGLMESYAPAWFTAQTDQRIRKLLRKSDAVLLKANRK